MKKEGKQGYHLSMRQDHKETVEVGLSSCEASPYWRQRTKGGDIDHTQLGFGTYKYHNNTNTKKSKATCVKNKSINDAEDSLQEMYLFHP